MRHHDSCLRSLALSLGLLTTLAATAPAQTGWTQWTTGTGANNHWYLAVYVPGGINWNNARTAAQSLGGDLATISSAAENTFVFQRVANPIFWRVVANPTRIFGPWLGGFQPPGSAEPLGGWTWTTGEPWGYTRWASGEPNNYQGIPEDRVHFFAVGTTPGDRWKRIGKGSCGPGPPEPVCTNLPPDFHPVQPVSAVQFAPATAASALTKQPATPPRPTNGRRTS